MSFSTNSFQSSVRRNVGLRLLTIGSILMSLGLAGCSSSEDQAPTRALTQSDVSLDWSVPSDLSVLHIYITANTYIVQANVVATLYSSTDQVIATQSQTQQAISKGKSVTCSFVFGSNKLLSAYRFYASITGTVRD